MPPDIEPAAVLPVAAAGAPGLRRGRHRIGGAVLLLFGLTFATFGGLILLGIIAAMLSGQLPSHEAVRIFGGAAIVGGLLLLTGLVLFALGIRSLNRSNP